MMGQRQCNAWSYPIPRPPIPLRSFPDRFRKESTNICAVHKVCASRHDFGFLVAGVDPAREPVLDTLWGGGGGCYGVMDVVAYVQSELVGSMLRLRVDGGDGGERMRRTVKAAGRAVGKSSAQATMRLKTGFAMNHLKVAHRCALTASQIEDANNPAILSTWFDEMMQQVPVAIVMAAAALGGVLSFAGWMMTVLVLVRPRRFPGCWIH